MATGTERVDIWSCPPHARGTLSEDAIDYMKKNGMWPSDDGNTGGSGSDNPGSGDSTTGDGKHVCEPDYELKHSKKNFPYWV